MTSNQGPKIALIDSGNVSIQLPLYVWENVLISMQHEAMNEKYKVSVVTAPNGLKEISIENFNCRDIIHKLKPIYFKLESTEIKIYPKGYTYQLDKNQGYCQVGLQGIPGESNEYRLGTIFLRNFYTSLDYEKDQIAIGVNRGAAKERAEIIGHNFDPFEELPDDGPTLGSYILIILMAIMCAGITIFVVTLVISRKKKQHMAQLEQESMIMRQRQEEEESGEEEQEEDQEDQEGDDDDSAKDKVDLIQKSGEKGTDSKTKKKRTKAAGDKQTNYLIQSESFDQDEEEDNQNKEETIVSASMDEGDRDQFEDATEVKDDGNSKGDLKE